MCSIEGILTSAGRCGTGGPLQEELTIDLVFDYFIDNIMEHELCRRGLAALLAESDKLTLAVMISVLMATGSMRNYLRPQRDEFFRETQQRAIALVGETEAERELRGLE